jgi:AraC family transcriptional activator of pobA
MNNPPASAIIDFNTELKRHGFRAYEIITQSSIVRSYNRKYFYKICLTNGKSIIHYASHSIEVEGNTLFFGNPHVPYSWEFVSKEQSGYACLFSEDFLKGHDRSESLQESPLFTIGGTPVFALSNEQRDFLASIYQKMIAEQNTEYVFKNELIRNYINLIIHEALKMQPAENFFKHKNAAERIASLFLELLERQFPIDNKNHPLQLKSPQDFARNLSVHINHLNRSVKEVTGKPTSTQIAERIITEAKALLQHTDWSMADIAYALGFEYQTYFNNFFKKMTGSTPKSFRP